MLCSLDGPERFQAVLGTRPCSRSAHFMLHYLAERRADDRSDKRAVDKLSTARPAALDGAVDESAAQASGPQADTSSVRVHLGLVVPKRHAKRAVTRNLVRREARAQMTGCADRLPAGDWVLRLRAPFDRQVYGSAASAALLSVVREEMSRLIADGLRAAAKLSASVPSQVGGGPR